MHILRRERVERAKQEETNLGVLLSGLLHFHNETTRKLIVTTDKSIAPLGAHGSTDLPFRSAVFHGDWPKNQAPGRLVIHF
jgi:hypothetical protein